MTISTPQNTVKRWEIGSPSGVAGLDANGTISAPIKMGSLAELGVLAAGVVGIETSGGSLKNATAISLRIGDGSTSGGIEITKFGAKLLLE
jgi:hypothetical protein